MSNRNNMDMIRAMQDAGNDDEPSPMHDNHESNHDSATDKMNKLKMQRSKAGKRSTQGHSHSESTSPKASSTPKAESVSVSAGAPIQDNADEPIIPSILNFPWNIYVWFRDAIVYERKNDGSSGSILYYNVDYAITVGWLIPRAGSVFSLKEQIAILGTSIMVCCLLGWGSCVNHPGGKSCIPLPDANTDYLTLTTLCSFTVAFFANSVLERWWSIRKHLQAVMSSGYELVIIFAGILSSDVKDATSGEQKKRVRMEKERLMKQVTGLLVLTLRLLFNSARGSTDFADLMKRGVISEDDFNYFMSINATSLHVCAILLNYIQEAARQGLLGQQHGVSEANMQILQNSVLNLRANAASVSMYIDVQMPYPFIQIISAVTYMFIIQLILVCSAFVAQGFANNDSANMTTGLLTISLYNFVLLGLLRLFDVLYNPLGDDAADYPGDTYMQEFETNLHSVSRNAFVLIDNNGILPTKASMDGNDKPSGSRAVKFNFQDDDE